MGISKDQLGPRDVFVDYDYEDVMFRYEAATGRFFRKFYGKPEETEVPHDNELLNSALRFGEETDAKTYQNGKPRG
jgi:nucleoid-associated protein YejK